MSSIILTPQIGEPVELQLNRERRLYSVENILNTRSKVYDDRNYNAELNIEGDISNVSVFVNEELLESTYSNGRLDFKQSKIFDYKLGFVQFYLKVTYSDGTGRDFYSEYASVLVSDEYNKRNVRPMLEYIYANQQEVLMGRQDVVKSGKVFGDSYNDFWAQIVLLQEIVGIYESCYGFFNANSRYKLDTVEIVDRTDKLQYIDEKTIRYITQHPEHLRQSTTGINFGRKTYIPDKTLMCQNRITYDIYENQVVVGFLGKVVREAEELMGEIDRFRKQFSFTKDEEEGYIVSARILYASAMSTLETYKENLSVIIQKLENLFFLYQRILKVHAYDCTVLPKPTAIFMSVPHYNRVFVAITKWFSKTGYNLEREMKTMSFFDTPTIYEAYVLIKLFNSIKESGFTLKEASHFVYPNMEHARFSGEDYNNTYIFESDDETITLYYEPVIYCNSNNNVNGISLFRNNTVSLLKEEQQEARGNYYVPDYVLKYCKNDYEVYIICDAKYSTEKKVRAEKIPNLTYKYLFSLSPNRENASIKGMGVIYGIASGSRETTSFYDAAGARVIYPFVDMIPLSEGVNRYNQTANLQKLLLYLRK